MLNDGEISIRMVSGAVYVARMTNLDGFEGLLLAGGYLAVKDLRDGKVRHINTKYIESYEVGDEDGSE